MVNTTDIDVKTHQAVHLRTACFTVHIYTTIKFKIQTVTKPHRRSLLPPLLQLEFLKAFLHLKTTDSGFKNVAYNLCPTLHKFFHCEM